MLKQKKRFIALSIMSIFLIQLVSAASFDFAFAQQQVSRVLDSALGLMAPILEKIIGDYSSSEFFFHKILLLILLIVITKFILERTPFGRDNRKVGLLISILVSVIAIRFIAQNNLFEAIFLQYGVLGIAISTLLPFILFFYFVQTSNVGTYGRKMFWAFYLIVLFFIWMSKDNIPTAANWIYGLTMVAAGVTLFFDKQIHRYFGTTHIRAFMSGENKEAIRGAKRRIKKNNDDVAAGIITAREAQRLNKEEIEFIESLSE